MTIATNDYPSLRHFIGCYYHPDWEETHGTVEGMVNDFIERAEPGDISKLKTDLDGLLDSNEDSPSILDWLVRIGCGGGVNPGNPREQLSQFRDLLQKGIEKRGS